MGNTIRKMGDKLYDVDMTGKLGNTTRKIENMALKMGNKFE